MDKTEEQVESFDSLLVRIKQMIDDGNAKIEQKIEFINNAVVCEISNLRDEVQQLKADYGRDIERLNEAQAIVELDVQKNKDAVNRLLKSNDLILTGVPFSPTENTDGVVQKVAVALGYCETDYPLVHTKRLARAPIVTGSSPPILIQFAFGASRDEFFQRYFSRRNLNLTQLGYEVDRRIYINENLTESARRIKGIALKLKNCGKIHHVYSKSGTIFVKPTEDVPALPIHFVDQLTKFGSIQNL